MARLKELYYKEVVPKLKEKFQYKNIMQVPRLEKVVINMGVGDAIQNAKAIDAAVNDLSLITGQKTCCNQSQKVHRRLQTARRYAYWL